MKKTIIAMMLVASTAAFAAEEAKVETPATAPAVVAQDEIKINVLPAEKKKGFFESTWDSVKSLFD